MNKEDYLSLVFAITALPLSYVAAKIGVFRELKNKEKLKESLIHAANYLILLAMGILIGYIIWCE